MITFLAAGCGCLLLFVVAALIVLFFVLGLSDDFLTTIDDFASYGPTAYIDEDAELVNLLIDGTCKEGEVFNEMDESCSLAIDCNDLTSCAFFGDSLVRKLEQQYGSLVKEETVATDSNLDILVEYDINLQDETISTTDVIPEDVLAYHSALWYSFAWLIPEHARADVTKFDVIESGDTLAYMYLHDDAGEEWTLGMNRENLDLASETMVTYIHEFAHLLSMRNSEIDYFSDEDACEGLYIEDSCVLKNTFLYDFYDQFYAVDDYDYSSNYFISDYAMSSIYEDFAESFAHFVLTMEPTTTDIAAKKVMFFYEYEDLVKLRAEILGRAATWLDRTVGV